MTPNTVVCGCSRIMRVKKNGITVEETTESGEPYRLWSADLWACPNCGIEVISGFGRHPVAEGYEGRYTAVRAQLDQQHPIRSAR